MIWGYLIFAIAFAIGSHHSSLAAHPLGAAVLAALSLLCAFLAGAFAGETHCERRLRESKQYEDTFE